MSKEFIYDLSKPYHLFSANCGLILRDKTNPIEICNKENDSHYITMPNQDIYLFSLSTQPDNTEAPFYSFIDSEGILEDYVLSISNTTELLKENEVVNYFYYLGKLIGQFAFLLLFNKTSQISFLSERYSKLKSSIIILLNNFPEISRKFQTYIASEVNESDAVKEMQKSKVLLEPSAELKNFLDSIDLFASENAREIPISTVFALNYIGLSYLLLGLLPRLIVPSSMSINDFFQKCSMGSVKDSLENLIISNEENGILDKYKVYGLCYTFKVLSDFYLHDNIFSANVTQNISFEALYNIGCTVEKYLKDENTIEGKDVIAELVINSMFNITPNLFQFCNMSHWIEPCLNNFGLDSECDNPIIYYKTLNLFLYNDINAAEHVANSVFESMYFLNSQFNEIYKQNRKINYQELKNFIETLIETDSNLISPKNIFKLLYIAGLARYYHYSTHNGTRKIATDDDKIAYDVIILAETAVYNMFQEWFNRRTKIYKFEKRLYSYDDLNGESIYKQLKYECYVSLLEYMRLVMSSNEELSFNLRALDSELFTKIIHYDLIRTSQTQHPEDFIANTAGILSGIENQDKFGINHMMDLSKGRIGIIYLLLAYPKKDVLLEIMTKHIPLTDFYVKIETNESNTMKDFVSHLDPNKDIVGRQSNTWLYSIVNSRNNEIINTSKLSNEEKFYLAYCLNYQFIKTNQAELFATGLAFDVIPVTNKEKIINEDRDITSSLESLSNEIFGKSKPDKNKKPIKYKKYGFEV